MRAPLRAVWFSGVVALCALSLAAPVQGDPGSPPAAPPPSTAPPITTPPAPPAQTSVADAAAAKADPNCQPQAVACAWVHCYPLDPKFTSYSKCIAASCQMTDRECVEDLISDLYDPVRERNKGTR